jgi:hypothetical protein
MTQSRWERERADWLLTRSKEGWPRRRRAMVLSLRANRITRCESGVGDSSFHDDVPDRLFARLCKSSEGEIDRLARVLVVTTLYAATWLTAGPAIALAALIYRCLWIAAPRIGRLLTWPWSVSAAAVGLVGGMLLDHGNPFDVSVWPRYFVVHLDETLFLSNWIWLELTLGLLLTALFIRESGWAAVAKRAARKPETNKHGHYIETPDQDKVRLDPLGGVDFEDAETAVQGTSAIASVVAAEIEPDFADDDERPVFADEEPVFVNDFEPADSDNNSRSKQR